MRVKHEPRTCSRTSRQDSNCASSLTYHEFMRLDMFQTFLTIAMTIGSGIGFLPHRPPQRVGLACQVCQLPITRFPSLGHGNRPLQPMLAVSRIATIVTHRSTPGICSDMLVDNITPWVLRSESS